jgi:hypothetical protein
MGADLYLNSVFRKHRARYAQVRPLGGQERRPAQSGPAKSRRQGAEIGREVLRQDVRARLFQG